MEFPQQDAWEVCEISGKGGRTGRFGSIEETNMAGVRDEGGSSIISQPYT